MRIHFTTVHALKSGLNGSFESLYRNKNRALTPDSHILRLQCVCVAFFSALMLMDQSVHTARGCGLAVRSRSGTSAAVQLSFPHIVYFFCAACAELK